MYFIYDLRSAIAEFRLKRTKRSSLDDRLTRSVRSMLTEMPPGAALWTALDELDALLDVRGILLLFNRKSQIVNPN
jgi:hypothetical protein